MSEAIGGTLDQGSKADDSRGVDVGVKPVASVVNEHFHVGEPIALKLTISTVPGADYNSAHIPLKITFENVSNKPIRILNAFNDPRVQIIFFSAKEIDATQIYRYTCGCANGGQPVTLYGPVTIARWVGFQDGHWKFRIGKDGNFAFIDPLPNQ